MYAFINHLGIQFKIDIRERGTLLTYYLVPLIFYFVMGAVFSSINPMAKQTLISTMTIFAVTMGAVLGMPVPIVRMRESGVLRAYRVCGIPGWAVLLIQSLSAFLHLLVVSLVIFITAPIFFDAGHPQNIVSYFGILMILLIVSIALGLLIGVTARNQSIATMLSQLIFLPTIMLGGIMFPASMLPEPLRALGMLLPATYIMQSFSGFAFNLATSINAASAIMVAVGIGAAAVILTLVRFKTICKSL